VSCHSGRVALGWPGGPCPDPQSISKTKPHSAQPQAPTPCLSTRVHLQPIPPPYLFPEASVPGSASQAGSGCPAHLRGPIQLQQRPGSQGLWQGLEPAQPLALQLPDSSGLPLTAQLLHKCDCKTEEWVPLRGWPLDAGSREAAATGGVTKALSTGLEGGPLESGVAF
jgi:hypothetical protein